MCRFHVEIFIDTQVSAVRPSSVTEKLSEEGGYLNLWNETLYDDNQAPGLLLETLKIMGLLFTD